MDYFNYSPRQFQPVDVEKLTNIAPEKAKIGKCVVKYCRNKKLTGSRYCSKHKHQRRKYLDPIGYYFDIKRQNARNSGIPFLITKEYFSNLVKGTGWIDKGGRAKKALTIDRIDNRKGYVPGNIQILTYSENSSKQDDLPF